ncbi:hypothetical protein C0J52_24580 [Blattella germanica]|nr:hypothetical protein C0J52_24580 [Blattella germanica]
MYLMRRTKKEAHESKTTRNSSEPEVLGNMYGRKFIEEADHRYLMMQFSFTGNYNGYIKLYLQFQKAASAIQGGGCSKCSFQCCDLTQNDYIALGKS